MAEKERSHSQDVTGREARILRATLMFAKESKLIALSVDATLLGHEPLQLTKYCTSSTIPTHHLKQEHLEGHLYKTLKIS